jgi:hypothetical protein
MTKIINSAFSDFNERMKIALLALFAACAAAAPQQPRVNETRFLETPIEWSFTSPGNNYPMTLIMKIGTPCEFDFVEFLTRGKLWVFNN